MHFAKYAVVASAVAIAGRGVSAQKGQGGANLKIPALWNSPYFKSSGPGVKPGPGPPPGGPLEGSPGGPPPGPPPPPHNNPSPTPSPSSSSLQENFQVHEPAPILTSGGQSCTVTLVDRSFANSYGNPSYLSFDPAASFAGTPCADPSTWTGLTLDIHGGTRGRQFDRLGTIWVGNNQTGQGVEVMRLDNPEPTRLGVYWDIKKDVGRYWALWSQKADVVFDLPNIVDNTYTGALNVTLDLTASVGGMTGGNPPTKHRKRLPKGPSQPALPLSKRAADVVIPLSKRLQTGNSIFLVGGNGGNGTTPVKVPQNAARAVVQVYASGTATEEFWYTGIPDQFYNDSPDAAADGYYGHGTYREVQLYVDGKFAGFVTPYPVIFTGGINPLLWRPSANYGTFDQPTYNIDITPWLGLLTDGQEHTFELAVVSSEEDGAINDQSWFVSGNVQVYLDASGERTTGAIVKTMGGERVFGRTTGKAGGDFTTNGSLTYDVELQQPRKFGVLGTVKTGSGREYVAGWVQQAQYSNKGFVNGTMQTNDQKSYGFTKSLVMDAAQADKVSLDDLDEDDESDGQVGAVKLDYNYPLYATSTLTGESFIAQVNQEFDRVVTSQASGPEQADLTGMVGDETTFVHAQPVVAVAHTTLSKRSEEAVSLLVNGAIANGTGTSEQSFVYRDMAGGTINRETKTNTTAVLEDDLTGSVSGRAQPAQLTVV